MAQMTFSLAYSPCTPADFMGFGGKTKVRVICLYYLPLTGRRDGLIEDDPGPLN